MEGKHNEKRNSLCSFSHFGMRAVSEDYRLKIVRGLKWATTELFACESGKQFHGVLVATETVKA